MPLIADFKSRWPALFSNREINAEFRRITTTSLTSKFMSQLDEYAPELIQIYRKKGGKLGHKITEIMEGIAEGDSIDTRRCVTLKALAVYLNEDPTNLIKEYVNVDSCDAQEQRSKTLIGIYANLSDDDTPEDVGVIIEGVTVLQDLAVLGLAALGLARTGPRLYWASWHWASLALGPAVLGLVVLCLATLGLGWEV